jgi:hypothetical protein
LLIRVSSGFHLPVVAFPDTHDPADMYVLREAYGIPRVIVEEARQWPAELIVLGTHGRRGLVRLLLGSIAEAVIRRAPVPVLVVRAGSQAPPFDLAAPGLRERAARVPRYGDPCVPPVAA